MQLDIASLGGGISGVVDRFALLRFVPLQILLQGDKIARTGFVKQCILHLLVELVAIHNAKFHEQADIRPGFGVALPLIVKEFEQLIADFLGNMLGNAADGAIPLERTAGDIERNIGAIEGTAQRQEEFRDDLFAVVADKHLAAKEFDLATVGVNIGGELRKVENPLHQKGIVGIDMNPKERIILEGIEVAVELEIVFVAQLTR